MRAKQERALNKIGYETRVQMFEKLNFLSFHKIMWGFPSQTWLQVPAILVKSSKLLKHKIFIWEKTKLTSYFSRVFNVTNMSWTSYELPKTYLWRSTEFDIDCDAAWKSGGLIITIVSISIINNSTAASFLAKVHPAINFWVHTIARSNTLSRYRAHPLYLSINGSCFVTRVS